MESGFWEPITLAEKVYVIEKDVENGAQIIFQLLVQSTTFAHGKVVLIVVSVERTHVTHTRIATMEMGPKMYQKFYKVKGWTKSWKFAMQMRNVKGLFFKQTIKTAMWSLGGIRYERIL